MRARLNFFKVVSIHALTWRATSLCSVFLQVRPFQSTPSHGGRLNLDALVEQQNSFNPRPHMEGDLS